MFVYFFQHKSTIYFLIIIGGAGKMLWMECFFKKEKTDPTGSVFDILYKKIGLCPIFAFDMSLKIEYLKPMSVTVQNIKISKDYLFRFLISL